MPPRPGRLLAGLVDHRIAGAKATDNHEAILSYEEQIQAEQKNAKGRPLAWLTLFTRKNKTVILPPVRIKPPDDTPSE